MYAVDDTDETSVDPWSSHLAGPELVPSYLVSKFAAQYRVVVEVLLAAQDTSLTGMSFDDIATAVGERLLRGLDADTAKDLLTEGKFNLDARLEQLEK